MSIVGEGIRLAGNEAFEHLPDVERAFFCRATHKLGPSPPSWSTSVHPSLLQLSEKENIEVGGVAR